MMRNGVFTDADGFIKVRLYDANGNPLSSSLSVVGGIPGVSYIDLTVTVTNTGTKVLTCTPIVSGTSTTPTVFANALTPTSKTVPITGNKKASWTSNLIAVGALESVNPVRFLTTLRCSYNTGSTVIYLNDTTGYVDLSITQEGSAGFNVNVNTGSAPSEYCGDNSCNMGETATSCPDDCAVGIIPNVKFRTTNTQYTSGAVGYSTTCGSALTAYGYGASSGTYIGTCSANMATNSYCGASTKILDNLPGAGYMAGGANASLWKVNSVTTTVCVCDDNGANYIIKKYLTTDSDATSLDNQESSFDSSKEIIC
jgi:hypothetical protein